MRVLECIAMVKEKDIQEYHFYSYSKPATVTFPSFQPVSEEHIKKVILCSKPTLLGLKKKKCLVTVARPTLFLGADPRFFF